VTRKLGNVVRVAFAVALVLAPSRSFSSPGSRAGFGPRSQAFAGAEIADAEGAPAVFENPAALVQAPDAELSIGTTFTSYDLAVDDLDDGLSSVTTLDFGAVLPGSVLTIPVAFGLALSLPNGRFSQLHSADPTSAYYPLDDSGPRLFDLGMALAVRPLSWLAVGGGVGFLAAAEGGFRVTGTAVAADGSGSEYESELRHAVDADLISVRYPIFGATLTSSKELTFGVLYRGAATIEQRVRGELEGIARVGMTDIPVRYRFETRASLAFLPRVIAFGGTARPVPGWRMSAQLDWEAWSDYPSPFARPDTELEYEAPPGFMFPPVEQPPLPDPVALSDRFVPRVGVERSIELGRRLEMFGRFGYAYQAAVVPERQEETLLVDLDRHLFGLGVGTLWRRPFAPFSEVRLDFHASLALGVARSVTSGPAEAPDEPRLFVAQGRESHRVSGNLFGAGAALSLAFDALGRSPEPLPHRNADFRVPPGE
jgi:long-chain fatty acid transport protein